MSTSLKKIKSTNGVENSTTSVTAFCGHSNLKESEGTRLCVQITVERENTCCWSYLTKSATEELIKQLQSVLDGTYDKYKE